MTTFTYSSKSFRESSFAKWEQLRHRWKTAFLEPMQQCCGSGYASNWKVGSVSGPASTVISWIRIRIRTNVISWIRVPIRINLQMTSQTVWKMTLFKHSFKVLSLYFQAWIRIKVTSRIRIRNTAMQCQNWKLDIFCREKHCSPKKGCRTMCVCR